MEAGWRVAWLIEEELQKLGLGTQPSFKLPTRYEAEVTFLVRETEAEIAAVLDELEKTTGHLLPYPQFRGFALEASSHVSRILIDCLL